jgi:hypothetical protein
MKHIDIEQLKKLAQAATPGPWAANPVFAQIDALPSGVPVCQLLWPTELRSEDETIANGDFIVAANPSAILGLIETIEQLRAQNATQQKRVEELEAALRGLMQACEQSFDWQYDPQFTATFSEAEQALSATAPQHDWRQIGEAEYECTICGADSEGNASECATAREGER